ncbi:MAG: C40 family peptidase [Burkholderiales bacterium]|nr:C40 family peptidase [Burkholderiales bacterium]
MPRRPTRLFALALLCVAAMANAAPETASTELPSSSEAMLQMLRAQSQRLNPAHLAEEVRDNPIVQKVGNTASDLVISAMDFLGVRYRRGGASATTGFDCSGFTQYVYEHSLGLVLPHHAADQARNANMLRVSRSELEPGDLVFFNTMRRAFSHVGIYIGEGKFIHAPHSGSEVRIDSLDQAYWAKRFDGARRAELNDANAAPRE